MIISKPPNKQREVSTAVGVPESWQVTKMTGVQLADVQIAESKLREALVNKTRGENFTYSP